jgi:cardiolipin synthase
MRDTFAEFSLSQKNDLINSKKWNPMIEYLEMTGKSRLTYLNSVDVFNTGKELFEDMENEIKNATSYIHMEYFTINYDQIGKHFFDLLKEKAKSGVEVKLILDGVGSRKLPATLIKELKMSNIEVQIFFPSYFPIINIRANYRTHRKICIVDSQVGYLGGFNIGDEYLGKGPLGSWRDTHIKIKGEALNELQKEFFSSWDFIKNQKFLNYKPKSISKVREKKYFLEKSSEKKCLTQIVGSAPDYEFRLIRDAVLHMIMKAKKYIYIETPYFIPDDLLFETLKIASLSGVNIKIIIPNKPDHLAVYWATHSYVGEMLGAGIKFYTYNRGFLHSKIVIVDDEVVSVGSANFDYRSFYQNFEINAFIYEPEVVKKLKGSFIENLAESSIITNEIYRNRKLSVKFKESVSRLFSPLL